MEVEPFYFKDHKYLNGEIKNTNIDIQSNKNIVIEKCCYCFEDDTIPNNLETVQKYSYLFIIDGDIRSLTHEFII